MKRYTESQLCPGCKNEFLGDKYRKQQCCSKLCARKLHPRGPESGNWRGGKITTTTGYIDIWIGKNYIGANKQGYIKEHRYIMEQFLGRSLEKYETVHHINGDKTDNRLENLQLRTGKHGNGISMKCNSCGSYDVIAIELK